MARWAAFPRIYEINTCVWLNELSQKQGRPVTLASVPAHEWDEIEALGMDAVWFMGVWERSPLGREMANRNQSLLADFQRTLTDFKPQDNVGSPYCIRNYQVAAHFGGREALASARRELAQRGMRLVLDYVPNHVAPDHPWVLRHPEYFIRGDESDLARDPASFVAVGNGIFACGRDPYFPAWPDVLQLNAFAPELRAAAEDTVCDIARQCDAVRCDMAMLMLNHVFQRTWGERAGEMPLLDYWRQLIPQVKSAFPDFLFIAEAYWDLEWELQQQGFAYCYDKRLYDRLAHEPAEAVRLHLCASGDYQNHLVRFLENHDEPRAAGTFCFEKECAAAVETLTLPGARLLHEGQLEGRKIRIPVFLARRPQEPVNEPLRAFYGKLLTAADDPIFRDGEWQLCERTGWPDNASYLNVVAHCWQLDHTRYLVVTNLGDTRSQARVRVPWPALAGHHWRLSDRLSGEEFERDGTEMCGAGLFVDLPGWGYHFLSVQPS